MRRDSPRRRERPNDAILAVLLGCRATRSAALIQLLCLSLALVVAACGGSAPTPAAVPRPPTTAAPTGKLPRWRGFNLLEKFHLSWSNKPFVEEDFQLIHELGFNFVRLPMDYRVWIENDDWNHFKEDSLKEIDQAVAWGKKHGIHVSINFHRGPGYSVAKPEEPKRLWTDVEAQAAFSRHWAMFARRYRGIPSSELSFNLLNEPSSKVEPATYAEVVSKAVQAIREQDPERLIIADGLEWGSKPAPMLRPFGVAESMHCYQPFELTHYRAGWVEGSDRWPLPEWPMVSVVNRVYGATKRQFQRPLVIEGDFRPGRVRLHVDVVSAKARLSVKADGVEVFTHDFTPGPGEGEWKTAVYKPEWSIYQNVYDRDYTADLPVRTSRLELSVSEGDWLTWTEIEIAPKAEGRAIVLAPSVSSYGVPPSKVVLDTRGRPDPGKSEQVTGRQWLSQKYMEPFLELEKQGVGIHVGEFGANQHTPHDVTLRWMEDWLSLWKQAGWGWALWNFRGNFGIFDSERTDVAYEDFRGHKLDRKMLELLQRY
jgi:aryl-phospho-beta-D-glucosidase BglC (GH1 family)